MSSIDGVGTADSTTAGAATGAATACGSRRNRIDLDRTRLDRDLGLADETGGGGDLSIGLARLGEQTSVIGALLGDSNLLGGTLLLDLLAISKHLSTTSDRLALGSTRRLVGAQRGGSDLVLSLARNGSIRIHDSIGDWQSELSLESVILERIERGEREPRAAALGVRDRLAVENTQECWPSER
jgi:hypothetical protein